MEKHFTHLHVHTEFSLLDGAIKLDALINYAKKEQFKAVAISDHGNIFGAVKFFQKCKAAGIKPILGIEAYLTEDATIKDVENKYYHTVLLVENEEGYRNLCKLISFSFHEGFYFKPRIDYKTLKKYNAGLIATSGCLGGHIPQLLKQNNTEKINEVVAWYQNVFGPERFYLEVQPEDQPEQKIINEKLYALSKEKNIPLVATADCHYVSPEDRQAHEIMLCIQTHGKLDDPKRYTFGDCRVHLRTTEQMLAIFKDHEDAVWNAGKIADRCNFTFKTDTLHFPTFQIPPEHTQDSYFRYLSQRGLDTLFAQNRIDASRKDEYQARLNLEMDLIIKMGYIGYFLVVSDFIQWAKRNGIPVGPGRGSAAGALVAWALEITNIDPIQYNLLFERFLNPERVSMPDIDIDFCIEGRERVIEYVKEKYGPANVCQIITFGTMMAKGVLKDVARVLNIPFEDANMLTSLIPNQLNITLEEAKNLEPKLVEMIQNNPQVAHLFEVAERLEGLTRHASKHAAGVVISPQPIDEVLPVYIPAKTTDLVTQFAMTELESIGFLKMDFLGLKTLTIIDRALKMIEQNHGIKINIDTIPLDDPATFALLSAGQTSGVFQLESSGLKEVLKKLQPSKFEDIIAVNALYRPGPLGSGMVDDFVERRHGRQKVTYILPELKEVLEETYGVIVYQEQVMKIASVVAGYSLGQADILRRAMGKKKAEVMAEQSAIFIEKSAARGVNKQKAKELFDLMAYFAGYGFNKSHSAAYALIAYQTAYLKAHYPAEFMAVVISLESGDATTMSFYLEEARSMGIPIVAPNVNTSLVHFNVKDNKIIFGLQGIKNVGLAALDSIIKEREKKPFTDILEFCVRVDLRTVNKRVIEHLISAGAFDCLPGKRSQKTDELSIIVETALEKKRARQTGQIGLFESLKPKEEQHHDTYTFQPRAEWTDKEKLEKEKEIIGFYISAHPLDSYKIYTQTVKTVSFELLTQNINQPGMQNSTVINYGLIKSKRTINTKKGDKMAFVQLEDYSATAELIIFPSTFRKIEEWLNEYQVFIIKGTIDNATSSTLKIIVQEMVPCELLFSHWKEINHITVDCSDAQVLQEMATMLPKGKIPLHIVFHEKEKTLRLKTKRTITMNEEIAEQLKKKNCKIKLEIG